MFSAVLVFVSLLEVILCVCPKNHPGEMTLAAGDRLKRLGRHQEAAACFEEVLRASPGDVVALRLAASNARYGLGNLEAAKSYYEAYVKAQVSPF